MDVALYPSMPANKPAGSLLAADDLCVGAFVAVHSVAPGVDKTVVGRVSPGERRRVRRLPVCGIGVPLQIRAISLPFIVCAVLKPGGRLAGPTIIDIRGLRLIKLSTEFVRAIAAFPSEDDSPESGRASSTPETGAEAAGATA